MVAARAQELERAFGDPGDAANPAGFAELLLADESNELLAAAEGVLDRARFGAEFVPVGLGGRLDRADELARILRPVFRRDVALGFGYGITGLFAAAAVWAAGSGSQRRRVARILLGGGRLAIVHHNLSHGNAMWRGEMTARPAADGGYLLSGRKDAVMNAGRADAYVVYARTDGRSGPRSHSVLLLDAGEGLRVLPRQPSTGMRGCRFAGLEAEELHVPAGALVGEPGEGTLLALRTFQFTRALVSSVVLGPADTALRNAVAAAEAAGAGGRQRRLLAGVFADVLVCEVMSTVVLRSLHALPDSAHLGAAAVKYLVPDLVRECLEELGTVATAGGSAGYLHKLLRDLPAAGLGHLGTAACQAVLLPQLPMLARESWGVTGEPPEELFRPELPLPPLEWGGLAVAGGTDACVAALEGAVARLAADGAPGVPGVLRALGDAFVAELGELKRRFAAIEPGDRAALGSPEACALADRYVHVAAAGAVLGYWVRARGDGFLGDPSWVVLALYRLGGRLGLELPALPPNHVERMYEEVVARYRAGHAYDLCAGVLAEHGGAAWRGR